MPRPQMTSGAKAIALNVPSMRGFENDASIRPSNSPFPSIGTAPVGAPNVVMIPASTRSLSCQSRLVTWNGISERSPNAVRPWNCTYVLSVAAQLSSRTIQSGSSE